MIMMGVDEEYRGRKIATNLIQMCFKIARLAGCDAAYVTATNKFTRKIFNNQGMEEFRSVEWDKIEFEGQFPCVGKDLGSDQISSHVLRLQQVPTQ